MHAVKMTGSVSEDRSALRAQTETLLCMVAAKEISLALPGALRLAGKAWGTPSPNGLRVLAVHGWMDNANSFDRLGPALASASGAHVVAIDLLGHGNSDHAASPSGTYHASEHIAATAAALDALGWLDGESPADGPVLLGHSMGGGICTLLAAAYADRVRALALCEGLGPLARPADRAPANLRKALDALRPAADAPSRGRGFSSVDAAARARVMGARKWPSKPGRPQRLSAGAALRIAERGTAADDGEVRFVHDRALALPQLMYIDEEMSLSCFRAIACPVLAVQAADGWPRPEPGFTTRCEALGDRLTLVETSGSHYAHLDDDSAPEVEAALASFLAPPA